MPTFPTGKTLEEKLQEAKSDLSNLQHAFSLTVQCPHCHARQGKDGGGICDMGAIHGARLKAAWDWVRKLQGSRYGESV